jgi:hypothetical protein
MGHHAMSSKFSDIDKTEVVSLKQNITVPNKRQKMCAMRKVVNFTVYT